MGCPIFDDDALMIADVNAQVANLKRDIPALKARRISAEYIADGMRDEFASDHKSLHSHPNYKAHMQTLTYLVYMHLASCGIHRYLRR